MNNNKIYLMVKERRNKVKKVKHFFKFQENYNFKIIINIEKESNITNIFSEYD
jgi:hypothetical protein